MRRNVASQIIGAQMVNAADGTPFTGTAAVDVTGDGGTQDSGLGTAPAHEGNGFHSYSPTQGETDFAHVAFTFTGTGAIPVTVQVYTGTPQGYDAGTDWADGGRLDLLLDGAASAGDPWTTTIPGAYGAGTAGKIVGDNLNATVSSRMAETSINTTAGAVDVVTDVTNAIVLPSAAPTDFLTSDGLAKSAVDEIAAAIVSGGPIDTTSGAVDNVTTVATTATNSDMLDAAGVRTAIGLASANLDTQLADLPTVAEFDARTLLAASYFNASTDKVELAATGLDLIVPADPGTTVPTIGTSSIVAWQGFFGALSVHKRIVSATTITVRDSGDVGNLATYAIDDDGSEFTADAAT